MIEPTVGPTTDANGTADVDAGGDAATIVFRQCFEFVDEVTTVSILLFALCIIMRYRFYF